jgi:hypothetical protein
MDALAAMTRERDEALAVVAEYKFGQTASARILGERDAAQSRAEALEKALRKKMLDCGCFQQTCEICVEALAALAALAPEPCGTCGSAGGSSCPDCGPAAPSEPKEAKS